jgi:ABC-type nitrate/sulfonate/bicarbonate transport system substrate-binding protein
LGSHEDQVRAFNTAHRRIDAWVHDPANRAALLEEIAKLIPTPPNIEPDKYYDSIASQVPRYFGTGLEASALQAVQDSMAATGELQNKVSLDGMIWSGVKHQ